MDQSSRESLTPHGPSPSPSIHISFESLLPSDHDDDDLIPPNADNITEFTRSTAWYVRNSLLLNPRSYFGHFERGTFNLYESIYNEGTKFARPFLPKKIRNMIENMRIINLSSDDKLMRCLHFPIQDDELRILLAIVMNLNNDRNFYKKKLTFAVRNAAQALPGRISYDAARILKEVGKNNYMNKNDHFGIFSIPTDKPVEHNNSMTIRSVPISQQYGNKRSVALINRIVAIGNDQFINVINTKRRENIRFPVQNNCFICSTQNGNFITCTKNGMIHEINLNNDSNVHKATMLQISNLNNQISELKVSSGGECSYAAVNENKTEIYSGIKDEFYKIELEEPLNDFSVNNDDIYVADENGIHYYEFGIKYAQWDSPKPVKSMSFDPMSLLIGCCTEEGCYLIDGRTPYMLGLGAPDWNNLESFLISPYMDLAVAITKDGFLTFDIRQPEKPISHLTFQSTPSKIIGEWMPESRLFNLAYNNTFNISCPYLQMPIIESYQIPNDNILSLHTNLQLSVVQQESSITFIGGFGFQFHVPSIL
ncbi:hypothetical protein TRFO_07793 [Tritrichomonas foetus]|uniref:Uncharacterized protein n=1 Tax=Tritrichomonas foetus TaxID=1144522 RepID=A0A1J4JTG0_9EUKA|nr:hypothetical protein TRFO_07793 [Tritrichomonas foetus]|eukprot:OHT00806.1 hypothetical protein TRFO_07793 [Tritrichomonas foetus]